MVEAYAVDLGELEGVLSALNTVPAPIDPQTMIKTLAWQVFALHARCEQLTSKIGELLTAGELRDAEIKRIGGGLADLRKTGKKAAEPTTAATE